MPGQLAKRYILIVLCTGVLISCGKKGPPSFIPGQITERGDGRGLPVDRRLARTWKDYDGDGVSDRKDFDMDDDGVPNLADQFPFDESKSGSDTDGDGIMDFIDFDSVGPREFALLQSEIFREIKVLVVHGTESFSAPQLASMGEILLGPMAREKLTFEELKIIVRYSQSEAVGLSRAEFDPYWRQVSFFPHPDHIDLALFNASFIHELGHVHAAENPEDLRTFTELFPQWNSPSSYGSSSSEEGYAENFLHDVFLMKLFNISPARFIPSK